MITTTLCSGPTCRERKYSFDSVEEYNYRRRQSIKYSLTYLKSKVWCTDIPGQPGRKYGFQSRKFMTEHNGQWTKSVEKSMRRSVQYWRENLSKRMEYDTLVSVVLSRTCPDAIAVIRTFLF